MNNVLSDQRPRYDCCGEFLGPEHRRRIQGVQARVMGFWPTEREQAEISNMLLEEAPTFSAEELRAVFPMRCRAWAEEKASIALMEQHEMEDYDDDMDIWADA